MCLPVPTAYHSGGKLDSHGARQSDLWTMYCPPYNEPRKRPMTTNPNAGKYSPPLRSLGEAIFIAVLICNVAWAQAATDATVPTAVDKTERVVSDSWITTKVKSEILANSVSKAFKVSVKTQSGVVSLGGKLPNQDAVDLVKMIAGKVNGVRGVDVTGLEIGM